MDLKPAIREFIVDNFLFGKGAGIKDGTHFFEERIIDSTGVLELVSFLEDTYNIVVEDEELVADNFSSLIAVEKFLKTKLNHQSA